MTEEWRDIAGYEGFYQVSSLGRVRSLDRVIEFENSRGTKVRKSLRGMIMKPRVYSNSYLGVSLGQYGGDKLIHRLVAQAFIDNPCGLPEVNHKNHRRDDNRSSNLEWSTPSQNIAHAHTKTDRKAHSKTQGVKLMKDGRSETFPSMLAASRFLKRNPGTVASAYHKGHRCAGWEVQPA